MPVEISRNCDDLGRVQCPDALIEHVSKYDEYGIVVHDGGSSMVQILFCPWCGTRLPESKRDRWFEELERRGVNPLSDPIPSELETDACFRIPL